MKGRESAGLDLSRKPFASLAASGFPLELRFAQTSPALPGPGLSLLIGMETGASQERTVLVGFSRHVASLESLIKRTIIRSLEL